MRIKNFLTFTGLWLYIPVTLLLLYAIEQLGLSGDAGTIINGILLILSILGVICTTISNYKRYKNGHRDFSLKDAMGRGKTEIRESKAARTAMYPPISSKYLSKMPRDFVLGKYHGRYIYCPIESDGVMGFLIGAPGAHKTVLLLSWLYTVYYRNRIYGNKIKNAGRSWNFVIVDIKGEIFQKLIKIKGKYRASYKNRLHVFQPSNRLSWGWDVFYKMRGKNVTPTVRLKAVQDIADALVDEPKGEKNPFFSQNAKKILKGVMYYFSRKGEDFIDIMKRLNETPMDKLLTEIVKQAKIEDDSITLGMLAGFVGKKDNESIQDVESTMKTTLEVFLYPDIVYALKNNPNKTSPRVLNDGKRSIDIAIEEEMLPVYRPVFKLLCLQILRHCVSEFKDTDKRHTVLCWDEFPSLGKVPELEHILATARSRHCSTLVIAQNLQQCFDLYGKELTESILNLCELKLFLSNGGDSYTEKYIQTMAGKYVEKKRSYNKDGFSIKNVNYSDEEKQIVDGKELMSLRSRKEMIAFIYGNYYRFSKLMYFNDRYLAPIAKDIKEHNDRYAPKEERSDIYAGKQSIRAKSIPSSGKNREKNNQKCIKRRKTCGKAISKKKRKARKNNGRTRRRVSRSRRR